MSKTEIKALISLLEDPDKEIFKHVKNKLLEIGTVSLPMLEQAWESNFDSIIQQRAELLIGEIQFNNSKNNIKKWIESKEKDLLEAWIILSKYQYPDIEISKINKQINDLSSKIENEFKAEDKAIEKIMKMNKVLFKYEKFKGNFKNYHAPENSFVNDVLKSRKGNPLSLSILYIILAQKLNLPIVGINLPKHFIIAYISNEITDIDPVQFYINPFSLGAIITRKDVESFLAKENIKYHSHYFTACGNKEIIKRIVNNLLYSFSRQGKKEKTEEILIFLQLFDDN
jgi:regulator of sirC expression with transglutaminase-like and TPR domain